MKYTATIMMSLLLLGVCSARTLDNSRPYQMEDNMKQRETDYSKAAQDDRREGAQNQVEQRITQQWSHLKETVYQKLGHMYQQATSSGNTLQIDDVPAFADPVYIGKVVDEFGRLTMNYDNALFGGLNTADHAVVSVDTGSQVATLTVSLKTAEIHGNYVAGDKNRQISGKFNIQMTGDVTYVGTYHYQQDGSNVQLLHSSGKLNYIKLISQYDNANFPDFIQNEFQIVLLRTINEKVHAEMRSKLNSRIQQYIQEVVSGHQQDPVEKVMREGLKNAIHGIQQVLSKRGISSIELTSNDNEMVYNNLRAKIASVKLNGVDKLYVANNQVSKENTDKVSAILQLAIDRPTATAVVNIHETNDENGPFRKINVDFDMEQLLAELRLEKATRQSGLSLRSYQAKVERIRPKGIEKFEGEVSNLIRDKLADQMKRYVEHGLNKFILEEYVVITSQGVLPPSQGVLPPSQEKQSAPSQM